MKFQVADYYDYIYDALGKDYAREAAIIDGLLRRHGRAIETVLDVGCGTGRHARALAGFGYRVTGIDLDPGMIEIAVTNDPSGSFQVGDMRDFDANARYDAIMCMFNTINNATTANELVMTLRNLNRHLEPGGLLVVEPWLRPEALEPGRVFTDVARIGDLHVCRMTRSELNGSVSTLHSKWLVGRGAAFETGDEIINLSVFPATEMMGFFREAGFDPIYEEMADRFGGRGLYIASKLE